MQQQLQEPNNSKGTSAACGEGDDIPRVSSNSSVSSSQRHRCCSSSSSSSSSGIGIGTDTGSGSSSSRSSSSSSSGIDNGTDTGSGSSSSRSGSGSSSTFFYNRDSELLSMRTMCAQPPASILVLLGPHNAGKTAFLRQYTQVMAQRQAPSVDSSSNLVNTRCYVDGMGDSICSPSRFASVLLRKALPQLVQQVPVQFTQQMPALAKYITAVEAGEFESSKLSGKVRLGPAAFVFGAWELQVPADLSFSDVLAAYSGALEAWEQARVAGQLPGSSEWPLLVVDEANALMDWKDQHATELRELLMFFVSVTKANKRSHVVLATSEYAFQTWLNNKIGPALWDSWVIGDFTQPQAKEFLSLWLQQLGQGRVSEEHWTGIYQVCGGNAGALVRAAILFKCYGDWLSALSQVVKDVWRTMKPGYRPAPDAGYTAADYATAVAAILGSPYNAVADAELDAVLGTLPLEAMVRANLLGLRPYSSWATDIDAAAFGPARRCTVVTAPTPLHLFLMREERRTLLAALDTQQVPPESSTVHSSGPSRPPSPTSDAVTAVGDQIAAVQRKIEDVEGQLQQLSSEVVGIRKAKGEGWRDELACLQQDKQHLVEKEQQLRKNERQLREKKLLLMKRE